MPGQVQLFSSERFGARQGVQVHANPGRFVEGQRPLRELRTHSPFLSPSHGIDKAAVVRAVQQHTSPR
jgi:hypothetical protein